ncbi:hypothetical protein DdX_13025 [Ditylenchus destructor]|uniref:Uncharacterized protein n=1 Tax=Ditylenchus destructor TaxID=166010 RepID=A0AAD4MU59_9BILA|nr:hypothetical protein DdX_13025 [Ditylenchus destructor]
MNTTRTYSHMPDSVADKENIRRDEQQLLVEKMKTLNDLEANYEDSIFDAIRLRENFIKESAKIVGKLEEKLNEQYDMLMSQNVEVDIAKISQHTTDQIIHSIEVLQRKDSTEGEIQQKINEMKNRQIKMDSDIDKKLDLIDKIMKLKKCP